MVRKITKKDSAKSIELQAGFHERRLKKAIEVATRRASRSSAEVQALFASAKVSGLAKWGTKEAVVSYEAPPFSGGLHQFFYWSYLDSLSQTELAKEVSFHLRNYLAYSKMERS